MGCIRKGGVRHGGLDTHTRSGLIKFRITYVLVAKCKRSAHLAVITPHKTGTGHTQNNAFLQNRIPTPQGIIGDISTIPKFPVVVIGGLRKILDVFRKVEIRRSPLRTFRTNHQVLEILRQDFFLLRKRIIQGNRGYQAVRSGESRRE